MTVLPDRGEKQATNIILTILVATSFLNERGKFIQ